jgi:hypothetical protein
MIRLNNEQAATICQLAFELEETAKRNGVAETPHIIAQAVEIAAAIKQQVDAPEHEGDLVDTFARVLQETPVGGAISGLKLIHLRKAILSPLELAKVHEPPTSLTCPGCGVTVENGALMTQWQGQARCLSCQPPSHIEVACAGHNKKIELPDPVKKRLRLLVRKSDCQTCNAPAAFNNHPPEVLTLNEPVTTPPPPAPNVREFRAGAPIQTPPRYAANPNPIIRERDRALLAGRGWQAAPRQPNVLGRVNPALNRADYWYRGREIPPAPIEEIQITEQQLNDLRQRIEDEQARIPPVAYDAETGQFETPTGRREE